ncbi:MAG: hypothetical protein J6O51_04590 [Bacteroidales bacterium]|nr:hypothetical protein [Bacteroidales bacterium]
MKKKTLKQLYATPDTVLYAAQENGILCQSSTLPDMNEGEHDFNWN